MSFQVVTASKDHWTRAISGLFFPLQEYLKGHSTMARLRALEESQWWSRERIDAYQLERLRAMIDRVYRHVPYYRKVFDDCAFGAKDLRAISDLGRLPFLTKALIRQNTDMLKADDAVRLKRYNTGGSSGEPLIFFIDKERVSHDVAAKWRATRWWNVDIGDPEIVVWGSPIELGSQDRLRSLRDRLLRTKLLPAFEMSKAKLDQFIGEIRSMRPRMLFGYPSALARIAAHADARGLRLDDLGIAVAFVTSERLYDHQRNQIGKTFGCRVANGYGGRDAGFIAHECPEGGMHISAEDIIVEIVGPSGEILPPGVSGEIVVTHLATSTFPFIRYRTGDMGVLDDRRCACGRGLPMLKEIQGRATDFVVAEDGTLMHGLALIYVLRDLPQIAAFKIIQESCRSVCVQIVPVSGVNPELEASIVDGFRKRLGDGVDVRIERLSEIKPDPSGKFRYVVSRAVN